MNDRFDTQPKPLVNPSRFSALLSGACPKPVYDTILRDMGTAIVTPTLGSIIPNWVLTIPKHHAVNAAAWGERERQSPLHVVKAVVRSFGCNFNNSIWFEHGATFAGSRVGCGVDHAHLHILLKPPFEFDDFCTKVKNDSDHLLWSHISEDPFAQIDHTRSYFVAGSGEHFIFAQHVERAGSQFFRKVIARLVRQEGAWDYSSFPHRDNVRKTISEASASL